MKYFVILMLVGIVIIPVTTEAFALCDATPFDESGPCFDLFQVFDEPVLEETL